MAAIRLVLIDLSGTLHVGKKPIDGCPRALTLLEEWARNNHACVRFLSNTTKESKASLATKLLQMGFTSVTPDRILTPLHAARETLERMGSRNPLCLLSDSAKSEISSMLTHGAPKDGVVVGLHPESFKYGILNEAFRLLKELNVPFVATHRGRYYKDDDGQLSLGPGAFVAALEASSGRTAVTVGKPEHGFFQAALNLAAKDLNVERIDPSEVVMIGDDVRDDVEGAVAMGFNGVLVRTGKFKPEDAHRAKFCVSSFVEFVDLLIATNGRLVPKISSL